MDMAQHSASVTVVALVLPSLIITGPVIYISSTTYLDQYLLLSEGDGPSIRSSNTAKCRDLPTRGNIQRYVGGVIWNAFLWLALRRPAHVHLLMTFRA